MLHAETLPPTLAPPAAPFTECAHCGQPVTGASFAPSSPEQFCCPGCRIVFRMLSEHALQGYYRQPRGAAGAQPALATGRDYAEFDDPAFLELYTSRRGDERCAELLLEGVHCAACVWLVEKLPALVPGVTSCRLDFARHVAYVSWSEAAPALAAAAAVPAPGAQPSQIAQTLDRLGYPPHPHRGGERAQVERREDRALLTRLAVAGACAGNSMLFALALYSGAFADMDAAHVQYFRVLSALVALPSVLWSAQVFYRGALAALRARSPHMDVPLSLGIVLAALSGTLNVLRGHGEIYFDSLTALVFVLLSARYVQRAQQRRAEERAGQAHALTPHTARRLDSAGAAQLVPAECLAAGDRIEVLAGESFPVDGRVECGSSSVDRAWLTGESRPEAVSPASKVLAGTTNLGARLVVVTEQSGATTRAAQLLREVGQAAARRAPIALLADRVSAQFLVGVLIASAVAFFAWLPAGLGTALEIAIALLIVTCPCGLALATPLAVSAALGQAARRGLLIKGGASLEALARPGLVVFDKTGTLTLGKLELVSWEGDPRWKPHVKALEEGCAHPIAQALVRALADQPALPAEDVCQRLGAGVQGSVDGHRVSIGAVHTAPGALPAWAEEAVERLGRAARTPLLVCADGAVVAVVGLGDALRPDALPTLRRLRALGYRLAMLSGDRQEVVDALAAQLEVEAGERWFEHSLGDQSPEQKLAWVERARQHGEVFMVGDGVNDAGALAAASVGIAVHGGAEASLSAAHVFATRAGTQPVLELIEGARRALRVIHLNLAFSLVYNLLAAGLTLAGKVTPIWAAVIMPLSSLTVVAHSYRRRMFRSPP